ncbi:unnamed protein product [Rotaria socialis]|uniref:Coiled-coil alpha-helical rod protein 1 n=2 Tax=Rotaria socialis TaxID=392032 RepID=A0A818EJD0_9BILA|nr:unnamed protein product [Rotaria socialis]CAF3460024.1 unnamed protein product [Rotaria socialis]CAF3464324.1 unnamed protein product [Rotaria socialis]CAF3639898.1 unnamed protein product [Rotaria socialis]CAF4116122.1 unnamed protein product [Rotaria socialis]
MTSTPSNNMLLLPPSAFQSTSSLYLNSDKENQSITTTPITNTVHEQLEQLQFEMGRLRTDNEALKTSGRDLLERAPRLISIPHRSNIVQETLEDIIQQQATEIERLRNELEREKSRCLVAINELEQNLRTKELSWKAQSNEFELRSAELQKVRKEKLYYEQLVSSQKLSTSSEIVSNKLCQQLEQREKENATLNDEMRLLNLRLTSMNDVLTLQEEKLEQPTLNNHEKRQSLLNCWRTKVYDLLMQLKSMELILKNNSNKFSNDIEQLQGKVNELLHENKLLQTQYDERKIHIQYLESKLHQSDSNLSIMLHENTSLKQRLQSFEKTEQTLRDMIIKYTTNPQYDDLFKTINKTLAIYEQRLGYINKRFLILQTLFNRQLLSLSSRHHTTIAIQTEDEQYIDLSLLERELKTVSTERDLLAHKLDQEYEQSKLRLEQSEQKYKQDFVVSNEKLSMMQLILEENSNKIHSYEIILNEKEKQLKDLTEKWAHEQQKQSENIDSLKREFREREENILNDKDNLEKQLNEAKREQAKLAANCRQMERTTTREKERWQRQIADAQLRSDTELDKLTKRIMTLERERNLLMKSIHQEKSYSPQITPSDDGDLQYLVSEIRQLASKALDESSDEEDINKIS